MPNYEILLTTNKYFVNEITLFHLRVEITIVMATRFMQLDTLKLYFKSERNNNNVSIRSKMSF